MNRRYIFRLIALSITTVLVIWFLADVSILGLIYFQFGGHFPLFVSRKDLLETAALGVGLVCSLTLYLRLVKEKRPTG
jgi:hypothetical protein